ncbi:MAG: pyridoxal phosphate-dependent aminotransferase [Myxococcales bacterium]|nr:pyridoxal phosphate-dependent aminotransferase [Myxococcales bacterium]
MLSRRSAVDRTPNALARALEKARREGRGWLDATASNPTAVGLGMPERIVVEALADPRSARYEPHPFGLPEARRAVAEDWLRVDGVAIEPEHVLLVASTSEAYGLLMHLLADEGDEWLVPAPSYPLLPHLARLNGIRLVPYRLAAEDEWRVDTDSIRRARTARTRALVAVSPNNPTGNYVQPDELDALASLGLPLVVDEVFARYPLREGARGVPSALLAARRGAPLVFALSGLSKLAALPQMKIAWIGVAGADDRLVEEALGRLEVAADALLSVATPQQLALRRWLEAADEVRARIGQRCRSNLAALQAALEGTAASVLRPQAGWYAVVRVPRIGTDERWALSLLDRGVLVHPGYLYDFEDDGHLVLGLLSEPAAIDAAARVLVELMRGLR